jgi:3-deoxy-manno-octulosonate cytidylyltransferase (CMP-KDO synthetase)
MKIVGVIPARYRSSRFPGKPLAAIAGEPMVVRTYKQASLASHLTEIYVATEDERIADECKRRSIPCLMTTDSHLTGTDRVAEVAGMVDADIYVNIQGDEPIIKPETIDAAILPFLEGSSDDFSVTNLCSLITDPGEAIDTNIPKVVLTDDSFGLYMSRHPVPYPKDRREVRHYKQVCVYAFRKDALLWYGNTPQPAIERVEAIELLRFLAHRIPVKFVQVEAGNIAVDTPEDLKRVNEILASQRSH